MSNAILQKRQILRLKLKQLKPTKFKNAKPTPGVGAGVVENEEAAGLLVEAPTQEHDQEHEVAPAAPAEMPENVTPMLAGLERTLYERLTALRHPADGEPCLQPMKALAGLRANGKLDAAYLENLIAYCEQRGDSYGLLVALACDPLANVPRHNPAAPPRAQMAHNPPNTRRTTPEDYRPAIAAAETATDDQSQWAAVLADVEVQVGEEAYRTWFQASQLLEVDGDVVVVGVANVFVRQELEGEEFNAQLAAAAGRVFGRSMTVEVAIHAPMGVGR